MKKIISIIVLTWIAFHANAQIKILFDATKAEAAGNADWLIDADTHNLGYGTGPAVVGGGTESNPQRYPSPAQSTVTAGTTETYWEGALSNWGIDCVKNGYQVETLPYNGTISYGNVGNLQDLTNYNIFVIDEPNIKFTAAEKTAIINFVFNGGRLFMISDHTASDRNNDGWDSPAIWNDLFTNNSVASNPFGMSVDLTNISGTSTVIANNANDSLLHGPYGDATQIKWSNGATITISPAANSTVKASFYKSGSPNTGNTNVLVAYARYGTGKVVLVGDSSPFDDGTGDPGNTLFNGYTGDVSGNHRILIMNATVWLATSNAVLAVSLTNFTAVKDKANALLQWSTTDETNTDHFNVQRSFDGRNFETVGSVVANGTPSSYSFSQNIDAYARLYPNAYFRLQIVDKDGTKRLSEIRSIGLKGSSEELVTVYPNPVKNTMRISSPGLISLRIMNSFGRTIKEFASVRSDQVIDVADLPEGIYFLNATTVDGRIMKGKFVK